jgi:hypothetical protein
MNIVVQCLATTPAIKIETAAEYHRVEAPVLAQTATAYGAEKAANTISPCLH